MKTNPKQTKKKPGKPQPKKVPKKRGVAKSRPLTVRQERFCELVAAGDSQTEAWLNAGYKVSRDVAAVNAVVSLRKARIQARIAEFRKPQTKKLLMSKDMKREIAMQIASNPTKSDMARIRAMELDAKLAGHFDPEKHTIDAGPNILAETKERTKQLRSALSLAYTVQ